MVDAGLQLPKGTLRALAQMRRADEALEARSRRLATGNRIDSALEGPSSYFAATGLGTRASDLAKLKEAIGEAIGLVQAGDKGIAAIGGLVEQARGLTTTAYGNLGGDPGSIATRRALAQQFNRIKSQIDGIVDDSGYRGKNLLAGDGGALDSTATSRAAADAIEGLSGSRVTNLVASDTYALRVTGSGRISANPDDLALAETSHGIRELTVSGSLSATSGNFADIRIEVRGAVGRTRTVVVTEGGESRTIALFEPTQSVTAQTMVGGRPGPGSSAVQQVSRVTVGGTVEEGDSFTVNVNGTSVSYSANADDVANPDPAARRSRVAIGLREAVSQALGKAAGAFGALRLSQAEGDGFTMAATETTGTGTSFNIGATSANARAKRVSLSFTSGTAVTFTVDRQALEDLGTAGSGVSTIEKLVDIAVAATNLEGVTVERSARNPRGTGKLTEGENAIAFEGGTVRFNLDASIVRQSASPQRSANLQTVQRSDPNTENDLTVLFNEHRTSSLTLHARDVRTGGQGLRLDFAQNDFLDRRDIDNAAKGLDFAEARLRSAAQWLSTDLEIIRTRDDFTQEFTAVLADGSRKLVRSDQDEEAAYLLAAQVSQQLAGISLSLAAPSADTIRRLFG